MPSIAMEAAPQPPHQKGRPGTSGAPESRFDASFNRLAHTFGIEKEGDEAAKDDTLMKADEMLALVGADHSLSRNPSDGLGSFSQLFSDEASQNELQRAMSEISREMGQASPHSRQMGSLGSFGLLSSSPLCRNGNSFGGVSSLAGGYALQNALSTISAANGWSNNDRANVVAAGERLQRGGGGSFGRGAGLSNGGGNGSSGRGGGGGGGGSGGSDRNGNGRSAANGNDHSYLSNAPVTRMMVEALARGGTPNAAAAAAAAAVSSGLCASCCCGAVASTMPMPGSSHAVPRLHSPQGVRAANTGTSTLSGSGNGGAGGGQGHAVGARGTGSDGAVAGAAPSAAASAVSRLNVGSSGGGMGSADRKSVV